MDGVGLGGVIFLWISFLWPIFVSAAVIRFTSVTVRSAKYWLVSIVGGYLSVWLLGLVTSYFAAKLFQNSLFLQPFYEVTLVALFLAAPVIVAFYASRKFN